MNIVIASNIRRILLLWAISVTGVCGGTALFDQSVTYDFSSSAAKVFWPGGQFDPFHQQHANKIAEIDVQDLDKERTIDVSLASARLDQQLILTIQSRGGKSGIADFFSEEKNTYKAPQIVYEIAGQKRLLVASIDTFIARKNRKSKSKDPIVKAGSGITTLLYFEFPQELNLAEVENAKLVLTTTNRQYGPSSLALYQLIYHPPSEQADTSGIADKYILDKGIDNDSAVYHADDFDDQDWLADLKGAVGLTEPVWKNTGEIQYVDHRDVRHFSGTPGKTVRMPFTTQRNLAGNLDFYFAEQLGFEPEEAYFRYYTLLAPGSYVSGDGKLPGFAGTYNKAGWGGRANNGQNGWSARGSFYQSINAKNPLWGGRVPVGSYIYEVDTQHKYGKPIPWGHERSTLQPGKWVSIEQYIKLNTPGNSDGVLSVWIDGVKIFTRSNLHFRDTDSLKIEKVWFNFYFGGVAKPSKNFDMYIDNIVIASSYIGPARQ